MGWHTGLVLNDNPFQTSCGGVGFLFSGVTSSQLVFRCDQVFSDCIVVDQGAKNDMDVPDGMGQRDHTIALEEDHANQINGHKDKLNHFLTWGTSGYWSDEELMSSSIMSMPETVSPSWGGRGGAMCLFFHRLYVPVLMCGESATFLEPCQHRCTS